MKEVKRYIFRTVTNLGLGEDKDYVLWEDYKEISNELNFRKAEIKVYKEEIVELQTKLDKTIKALKNISNDRYGDHIPCGQVADEVLDQITESE